MVGQPGGKEHCLVPELQWPRHKYWYVPCLAPASRDVVLGMLACRAQPMRRITCMFIVFLWSAPRHHAGQACTAMTLSCGVLASQLAGYALDEQYSYQRFPSSPAAALATWNVNNGPISWIPLLCTSQGSYICELPISAMCTPR
jgi:hypothetical protein